MSIETSRRLQARVDLDNVQLAREQARREGASQLDLNALVQQNYLPPRVLQRADQSHVELAATGTWFDSKRARGDVFANGRRCTDHGDRAEAAAYQQLAVSYHKMWAEAEPLIVAIQQREVSVEEQQKMRSRVSQGAIKQGSIKIAEPRIVSLEPLAKMRFVAQVAPPAPLAPEAPSAPAGSETLPTPQAQAPSVMKANPKAPAAGNARRAA